MAERYASSSTSTPAIISPIPSLLATSAIHQHLLASGLRARVGLLVEAGDDTSKVNILNQLCRLISSTDLDTALYYCTKSLILANQINFKSGKAISLFHIGTAYYYEKDYGEGEEMTMIIM